MIKLILKFLSLFLRLFTKQPPGTPPTVSPAAKGAWVGICITMLAGFEGLYTHAYKDVVGVTTVCYGATNADRKVKMGDTYTVQECKDMLAEDLPKYSNPIEKCVKVAMPPHRKAAIVSFAYNVGTHGACNSTVVRKLNAGDVQGGCDALMAWTKAGGRVIKGLVNRRTAERKDCLRND